MKNPRIKSTMKAALLIGALSGLIPVLAYPQGNFYEGKTITVIAFTAPGGSGDLRVKATVPFLKKHIPGNPTIVIEYMDGGGGRKGANHIYHSVRPDGLTIGAASGAIVGLGIMREQGASYDVDKFIYLGTAEHENHAVIYTRRELGLDNLEKLKAKPGIRIGGQTVGHVSYAAGRFFAYFLDLKEPKFIVGYTAPEVDVALVNGELDARANAAVSVCAAIRSGSTKD
jgi:tripartite-type tricarboxylate transporter receptor subunit TctC